MGTVDGARSFQTSGEAYDAFMDRCSRPLAVAFADRAGVVAGQRALDVGCGPGALTGVLVDRLGPDAVTACDPVGSFVAECAARHPGVDVRQRRAEALPVGDDAVDLALSQLVLHFVSEPTEAAAELVRAVRPGGTAAACVWDSAEEMEMLRHSWDAVLAIGLDELWSGFLAGIGPAGACCAGLPGDDREALRAEPHDSLGSPSGSSTLEATARCAVGRVPGRAG